MSIKVKASPGTTGALKARGGNGRIKFYTATAGVNGGVVYWTYPDFLTEGNVSVAVNTGDTVQFQNFFAADNSLTSTYTSQAYTISTSDSSYNAVSQIASGNVPLNLGDISFSDSYGSTYSTSMFRITLYHFIANVSDVTFKIAVAVLGGGGGGGGPM